MWPLDCRFGHAPFGSEDLLLPETFELSHFT
jgi:hypothetical protein